VRGARRKGNRPASLSSRHSWTKRRYTLRMPLPLSCRKSVIVCRGTSRPGTWATQCVFSQHCRRKTVCCSFSMAGPIRVGPAVPFDVRHQALMKASRSALITSACVVGMPCGKPL
jgi:hypothetical protein